MIAATPGLAHQRVMRAVDQHDMATLRAKSLTLSPGTGIHHLCDPNQVRWARATDCNTHSECRARSSCTTACSRAQRVSISTTTWCSSWRRSTSWSFLRTSRATVNRSSRSGHSYPRYDETPLLLAGCRGARHLTTDLKGLLTMIRAHGPDTTFSHCGLRLCLATNCGCGGQV